MTQAANYYHHPSALVESSAIGLGTRIGAFARIAQNAKVGQSCDISDYVLLADNATVGNRVTIKSGVYLWHNVTIDDDVFLGANVSFACYRGSGDALQSHSIVVREGAIVEANATIAAGVTIGRRAFVGAGSVVTHDVPANAKVTGNPAQIVGYLDSARLDAKPAAITEAANSLNKTTKVRGVSFHHMPIIPDLRGTLSVGEFGSNLPFIPQRYFVVFDVPNREIRGEHAHKALHQFLVCLNGDCSLVVDDGVEREELLLNTPAVGIHVEPLVWGIQYKFSRDAILLVLASDKYDPTDYIRDYDEFEKVVAAKFQR